MRDRHADLADLALGQRMVAVVAGLGRQIEGDRKAGLPLAQIVPVQLVRGPGVGVARIGAENPGFVGLTALRLIAARRFAFTLGGQRLLAARLVVHGSFTLFAAFRHPECGAYFIAAQHASPSPRVRGEGGVRGRFRWAQNRGAQNC